MGRLTVRQTQEFSAWLRGLRDRKALQRIINRLDRLPDGNFGDAKQLGGGIAELRFAFGPGYRIYYTRIGDTLVLLLCGGDKSSQPGDIERARRILAEGDWE